MTAVAARPPVWRALVAAVADMNPGAFAFVMATGIVSTGLQEPAPGLSAALLWIGVAGYATLIVGHGWRLACWRAAVTADLSGPRAFAFLTFVAASNVLASRFALGGDDPVAAGLLAAGAVGWVVLGYGVPLAMIASTRREPSLELVNGTWFIWVVGTQSVAVAAATLGHTVAAHPLAVLATVAWGTGVVQYLLTAGLGLARLLVRPVAPGDLIPAYWVFMGAAAISVLGAAKILQLPPGEAGPLPRPFVAGFAAVLWAFCTWLIPFLLLLGVWRHVVRRDPLRHETSLWSMVFPVGMYGVASRELGKSAGTSWLRAYGDGELWVALAVWALVAAGMVVAAVLAVRRVEPAADSGGR